MVDASTTSVAGCWSFALTTQRLQCSSFLGMTYFLLREHNILPKKELHSSLCVNT